MAYRRLGRTNMMISEVVSGGDPITPDNYKHLAKAIERGLNYLDMAPAYHDGGTETRLRQAAQGVGPPRPGLPDHQGQPLQRRPQPPVQGDLRQALREQAGDDPRPCPAVDRGARRQEARLLPDLLPRPARLASTRRYLRIAMMPDYSRAGRGQPGAPRHDRRVARREPPAGRHRPLRPPDVPPRRRRPRGPRLPGDRRDLPEAQGAGQGPLPRRHLAQRPGRRPAGRGRRRPLRRGDGRL